jgi:hypothetical protein
MSFWLLASALVVSFVAAVALPHLCSGLLRGWRLRHAIDWQTLSRFGILSALFGLSGAFVFAKVAAPVGVFHKDAPAKPRRRFSFQHCRERWPR